MSINITGNQAFNYIQCDYSGVIHRLRSVGNMSHISVNDFFDIANGTYSGGTYPASYQTIVKDSIVKAAVYTIGSAGSDIPPLANYYIAATTGVTGTSLWDTAIPATLNSNVNITGNQAFNYIQCDYSGVIHRLRSVGNMSHISVNDFFDIANGTYSGGTYPASYQTIVKDSIVKAAVYTIGSAGSDIPPLANYYIAATTAVTGTSLWDTAIPATPVLADDQPGTGDGPQQRTFNPPTKGVKFHTSFYRDASLADIRFDASDNIQNNIVDKLRADISNAIWSDEDNSGVTIVSVQTISNEEFTNYLGAYTLKFSNWDFSANLPLDGKPVGKDGKNIFKKTETELLWDGSTNMMVGIPTNYIQDGTNSKVNFPVAISDSSNNMNALNHTLIDASDSFIDLYSILGKPKLEAIVNAYDQNLNAIDIIDLSFETYYID